MTAADPLTSIATEDCDEEAVASPLSYEMRIPLQSLGAPLLKRWWSHTLYRGPDNKAVEVLYSKTKEDSEALAQKFLDEPIVGFDMEWPVFPKSDRLQEKIGLIQIASEDKIGLFHIGLHPGRTTEDIIAPSLQKIIESPTIAKTGVAIANADFSRMSRFFGLKPQAAFELSHLHRLVHFGGRNPELITTKLVRLSHQVETHLGLPLSKGAVRTSNWSRPLNQQQIDYAAADAYAGFMLFHCMNAKRLAMDPTPPLPLLVDKYPAATRRNIACLQLHPLEEGGPLTTIASFYGLEGKSKKAETQDAQLDSKAVVSDPKPTAKAKVKQVRPKQERVALDGTSLALFNELSLRRRQLAGIEGIPPYRIASNATFENIARERPLDEDALLQVAGMGKISVAKYGAEWLQVIALFVASNNPEESQQLGNGISLGASVADLDAQPSMLPTTPTRHRRIDAFAEIENSSSPGFGTPRPCTPVLHTGLSFNMAETKLDSEDEEGNVSDSLSSSSVYATPLSRPVSQLKRKRSESPVRKRASPSPPRAPPPPPPEPLRLEVKIFRNKLLAFSKMVATKQNPRPSMPLVTDWTLDRIVCTVPRNQEELKRIPGIDRFIEACERSGRDLLANIHKFAPTS
jgi:ribonuclease D